MAGAAERLLSAELSAGAAEAFPYRVMNLKGANRNVTESQLQASFCLAFAAAETSVLSLQAVAFHFCLSGWTLLAHLLYLGGLDRHGEGLAPFFPPCNMHHNTTKQHAAQRLYQVLHCMHVAYENSFYTNVTHCGICVVYFQAHSCYYAIRVHDEAMPAALSPRLRQQSWRLGIDYPEPSTLNRRVRSE